MPDVESTVPLLKVNVLPLASWRLAIDGLMSRVTVLVPFVMQTFVEPLFGTTAGLQFAELFQLLLPSFQVERVPVSVHWPKADAEQSNAVITAAKAAGICLHLVRLTHVRLIGVPLRANAYAPKKFELILYGLLLETLVFYHNPPASASPKLVNSLVNLTSKVVGGGFVTCVAAAEVSALA